MFLDTHVCAWLYADAALVPANVRQLLEERDLFVSPMVELELEYLFEVGRVAVSAAVVLAHLSDRIGLRLHDEPFSRVARAAIEQTWTRDPFDRVIVGHAALCQSPLVTRDGAIIEHYRHAYWSGD